MGEKRTRYSTDFGACVSQTLAQARMTQKDLASATSVHRTYVNHILTGRRSPSARWVDLVADATNMDEDKRRELHKEAAKAHGFKL